MMKFPYELSEDRLSLLSQEDRDRYEYEHSPYFSVTLREEAEAMFREGRMLMDAEYLHAINEDEEFKDLEPTEKAEMADELAKQEASAVIDAMIERLAEDGDYSEEQIADIKEYASQLMLSDGWKFDEESLDEAQGDTVGHDMTYWMQSFPGWLKGLMGMCGTGLTLAVGGMASLVMWGLHKKAVAAFEKEMNRTVEELDMGVNKKKSFFSTLKAKFRGHGHREDGDQSQACFRSIQEIVERDIAKNSLVAGVTVGLLSGDGMQDAINFNSGSGGLNRQFVRNVVNPLQGIMQINDDGNI